MPTTHSCLKNKKLQVFHHSRATPETMLRAATVSCLIYLSLLIISPSRDRLFVSRAPVCSPRRPRRLPDRQSKWKGTMMQLVYFNNFVILGTISIFFTRFQLFFRFRKSGGGGKKLLATTATIAAAGGGVIGYAYVDPEFRHKVSSVVIRL